MDDVGLSWRTAGADLDLGFWRFRRLSTDFGIINVDFGFIRMRCGVDSSYAHTVRRGTLEGDRILWLSLLHRRPSALAQEKTTALRSETLEDPLRDLVC
jgi:hypothetical protein